MKSCVSIALGGEVILASDCSSYEDYNILKLKCSICNNPVFYKAGSTYIKNNKEVVVGSCFSHFPSCRVAVEECDLRVNGISSHDIEKKKGQARNQRLKIYQRHFWNIVVNTYPGSITDVIEAGKNSTISTRIDKQIFSSYIAYFQQNKEAILKFVDNIIAEILLNPFTTESAEEIVLEKSLLGLEEFRTKLNHKLQLQIIKEVILFLSAKSSLGILEDLYYALVFEHKQMLDSGFLLEDQNLDVVMSLVINTVSFLAGIPWAEVLANCITESSPVMKSLNRPIISLGLVPGNKKAIKLGVRYDN